MIKRFFLLPALLLTGCLLLCSCAGGAQTYTNYVQAVLDCTYHGDTAAYCTLTHCSAEEAQALYQAEIGYVAELICNQMAVKPEYLTEETRAGYEALAEKLINKLQYTVQPAVKCGSAYQITIIAEPTDFWDICIDDVEASYSSSYAERFGRVGIEHRSEIKLAKVEANWGAQVLYILNNHIDEAGCQPPVIAQFEIRTDENGVYTISGKDWMDVDDLLLDIAVNN